MSNLLSFSSLFSVKSEKSNQKYREAIETFALSEYVDFVSVEDNYANLLKHNQPLRGVLLGVGDDRAKVVDVPALGDCAFLALLAPLIGFVPDRDDTLGIIQDFRKRLSSLVVSHPERFDNIFGSRAGLLKWAHDVKQRRMWDGDEAYAVFSKVTGIVVHHVVCSD